MAAQISQFSKCIQRKMIKSFSDEFVRHAQPHRSGRSAGEEAGDERPGEFVCRRASATGSMGP